MRQPKHKPGRSMAYLEYIRSLPCCVCRNAGTEPYNTARSDFSCIPQSGDCRDVFRRRGKKQAAEWFFGHYLHYEVLVCLIPWCDENAGDE